jgi:hypothetical protein
MSPLKRGWDQFVESLFLVGSLVAVLEVILPVIQGRGLDWQLMLFACAFGLLIVFVHTAVAYMRSPYEDHTAERVERALAAFEARLQLQQLQQQPVTLAPSHTQFKKIKSFSTSWQDISQETTEPDRLAYRPATRR